MKSDNKITLLISQVRPRYIIAVTFVIAAVMIISAVFELSQSKKELNQLMTEEATSLIETISLSSANAVLSNEEIENLISQHLLSTARMTAYLDSMHNLSQQDLETVAAENNVFRINIFDKNGNKVLSSYIPDSSHINSPSKHEPKEFFDDILKGLKDEMIIGLKEARHNEGKRFAVAVKRKINRGGAVVANLDASYLLEFRKKIGFGKMIQDIGDNRGVEYILLQDEKGIIAASRTIKEMSSVNEDVFLSTALEKDSVFIRESDFEGHKVFEVVKPFFVEGDKIGLFRLGISMSQIDALESRMIRRGIILSVVLFVIAVIAISTIFVSQNLTSVKQEFEKVQTYTGNIIENMTDALVTTDKNGLITIFNKNAESLFNLKQSDVIGSGLAEVFGKEFGFLEETLGGTGDINNIEIEYKNSDKPGKILLVSTAKTNDKSGNTDSFTIVFRDITNLKSMEKQVLQHDKMVAMGELASGVAHEIRNPLNAISMIAQRYKKEFSPGTNSEEYNKMTELLLTETKRVNNIISQFLRFARPPKLNRNNVKVKDLIKDVSAMADPLCKSKGLAFDLNCDCDITVNLDIDLMKQVLLNIIQNAIDATSRGKISLAVFEKAERLVFEISDTGHGIPEDKLDKVFNLYFTTKPSGTGMGLSIVQQIISQHNGNIKVESMQGKGTKFIMEIPVNKKG